MLYQLAIAGIVPMHVIDNNTFSEVGSKCIQMFDPEGANMQGERSQQGALTNDNDVDLVGRFCHYCLKI